MIGCDGFGYVINKDSNYKIPQTGKVEIKNNVEVWRAFFSKYTGKVSGIAAGPPILDAGKDETVFDDNDEPVLATFTNWQLEYETKQTTDIRELSEDIQGIVDALRDINFKAIYI